MHSPIFPKNPIYGVDWRLINKILHNIKYLNALDDDSSGRLGVMNDLVHQPYLSI